MTVTFFGHRNTPDSIQPSLKKALIQLIEQEGADTFYVGNEGNFDCMAYKTLKELKTIYPFIEFKVMLAYLTKRKSDFYTPETEDTVFPDGLLKTPLKFAISKRNNIMLKLADTVVMYACAAGSTLNLKALAEDRGKRVINLYKTGN
ncbi:MAG TPA: hypothetical protein DEQ65_01930 [Ruminococcaceae bacterium]|nr:hypothetical protein [Oscillospiraceae bacterium]